MERRIFKIFIFVGLAFYAGSQIWAVEDRISISSRVDQSRITIGDLIKYTVTVAHDESVRVELPGLGANLGGFEIRDYDVLEPRKEKGKIISTEEYTISTFFTGEFIIPPLTVAYTTPEDTTVHTLSTETIKIVVESVKPSEAGDIKDIKLPVEIPRNLWVQVRWFVFGGLLIGLSAVAFILYRRKKQGKGLFPVREEPPRPPHEIAYENLDRLRESDLLEKREIKRFYIDISEVIRHYIGGRYFVVAMEMTTFEVLEGLSEAEVSEEEFQLFQTFLERCDLVKFAKYVPSENENQKIIQLAYDIVDRTKVIIEESAQDQEVEGDGEDKESEVTLVETEQQMDESNSEKV